MATLASDWRRHFRLLLWNRWTEFNEMNLTGSKISTSFTKFVFLGPIGKNNMTTLASDWLRHFWLLLGNRWTELNQTWQEARYQRPLPSLCFRTDRKNKMAALAYDWLRHFWLLLGNRWTELNETWQEARYQRPLPSLCFRTDRKNKMAALTTDWLRHFLFLLWNCRTEFNENMTGSKISTSSTKFVFFGPIGKSRWPPWPLIGWDIFDFSFETTEWNLIKLDKKQDFNILYQVFFSWLEKQDGSPGLWLAETFSTSPLKPLIRIQRNLTGSKISTSSTKFVFLGRSVNKNGHPGRFLKKIAHCTQVHDMWPFVC